jgi:hypothetical protein
MINVREEIIQQGTLTKLSCVVEENLAFREKVFLGSVARNLVCKRQVIFVENVCANKLDF